MPNYQGIEDDYLPLVPKPSLQQYDNYQINDLYSIDIIYGDINQTTNGNNQTIPAAQPVLFKRFLAVERVSLLGAIPIDFSVIAETYK